jgi:integrase/recombinase XerD
MRFDEFLKEREYLLGVSQKTLIYYQCAFNSWKKYATDETPVTWIKGMKDAGLKPVSINTYICAMNAYWMWSGEYNRATKQGKRLAYLKEEQNILKAPTAATVHAILRHKPKSMTGRRVLALVALLCDTGLRIEEAVTLERSKLNFDAMTVTVRGKGNKERVVPMSQELRKILYRYTAKHEGHIVFSTASGGRLTQRNALRDLYVIQRQLGLPQFGFHGFRHFFAVSYLRNGGNLFYLSRILGHTSIRTTELYLKSLGVEDLGAVHNSLSPLARH